MNRRIFYFFFWIFITTVSQQFEYFYLSTQCKEDPAYCTDEEMEFKAISELHSQIDDDKNGDIDIYESKDFVQGSLATPHGSEKARKFHRNDSHITKQDLWNIWRSSEVYNWTNSDLVNWMTYEVELPQYVEHLSRLGINGSSMPRFTELGYLSTILKISDSIHKRKISIKAVDAVLFGSNTRYQVSRLKLGLTIAAFVVVIVYLAVQNLYSKRYMRNMQGRLSELSRAEDNLASLRHKLEEIEEIKIKRDFEIQELHQKHIKEIQMVKDTSLESLNGDSERLQESRAEILRLNQALDKAHIRIGNLSKRTGTVSSPGGLSHHYKPDEAEQLLMSVLQWTKVMEDHYLKEKEAVIDQECTKFREWNEKLKKRKSGFLGVINLAHSGEMDEVEKGFVAMKKAYEKLIQEKQDERWRWKQIELLTGISVASKITDVHSMKQTVMRQVESMSEQQRLEYNAAQRYKSHPEGLGSLAYSRISSSRKIISNDEDSLLSSISTENLSQEATGAGDSGGSTTETSQQHHEVVPEEPIRLRAPLQVSASVAGSSPSTVHRSRKPNAHNDKKRSIFRSSRTRIPSLSRTGMDQ